MLAQNSFFLKRRLRRYQFHLGDNFPANPRKEIQIFDIDGQTVSVKLTTDDWVDLMHLVKLETGEWKVVNVLWQYHNQSRHVSKR